MYTNTDNKFKRITMGHDVLLDRYAQLLVKHGLNVQKGQLVCVSAEVVHRKLVQKVVEHAYKQGAKYVHVELQDPVNTKTRLKQTQNDTDFEYIPDFVKMRYNILVDEQAANLRIDGSEDPELLADIPAEKVNAMQLHFKKAMHYFYEEGIGKAKVQWTVASGATEKWGQKVFPELTPKDAEEALWKEIFSACRVDREDCLAFWQEHNTILNARAKMLTEMKIKELHFTGPGTDLRVRLSTKARFKGGSDKSARGVEFEPNIPTEECFTTPDYRYTEGVVKVTRPILVNGTTVEGLILTFEQGRITNFDATKGKEQFRAYIDSDPGARQLGEVALVDVSSPIYQSKKMFHSILYDENAACHIAVGSAYAFCLVGGETMTKEEQESIGCNKSHTHLDVMISSEQVDVSCMTYDQQQIQLMKQGKWVI